MMTDRERLTKLLDQMDVPKNRYNDYGWLQRNLNINNYYHPNILDALALVKRLRQEEYLDKIVDL